MRKLKIIGLVILITISSLNAKEYHVSKKGSDSNIRSKEEPFKTISKAIEHAYPGDTITVHEGVYREWLNPLRGGLSNDSRIVYRAAPGEKVEIKGSEIITDWEKVESGVYKVAIPNSFFEDYNPYLDSIHGDWFKPKGRVHHTGEVYINEQPLYEGVSLAHLKAKILSWYCTVDEKQTHIR